MEREKKHMPKKEAEVIVINDDDFEMKTNKSYKNRNYEHKRHYKSKRKVKVETTEDKETLIVTQKVEVKKKKLKCIINLTNICKHSEEKKQVLKKSVKYINKDRIVPQCMRKRCYTATRNKTISRHKHSKGRCKKKENSKNKSSKDLSPISSLEMGKISDITYENISSGSLNCYSDDELDTLIKRTRDRERKLSKTFDYLPPGTALPTPLCSSTPQYIENVSDVENSTIRSGDMDISLQSLATLVLEPQLDIYSPTQPTGSSENDQEHEETIDYSPVKNTFIQMNQNFACDENIMYLPSKSLGVVKLESSCIKTEDSVCSIPLISNLKQEANIKTEFSEQYERPEAVSSILSSVNGKSEKINEENQFLQKFLGSSPKRLKLEENGLNHHLIKTEINCLQKSEILNYLVKSPSSITIIENDFNENVLSREVKLS